MAKWRGARAVRLGGVGTVALLLLLAPSAAPAQQGNGNGNGNGHVDPEAAAADSAAAALARADSARAALVQPPGSYGGVRAMDVIRIPFQLFGATVALGLYGAGAVYQVADELLIDPGIRARDALAEIGVDAGVDSFGNRSWPGVVLRYEGLSPFYAEAGYSLRQYEHYQTGVEIGSDALGGELLGRYQRRRQPHFWGVGPDSREADRSDFQWNEATAGATGWWAPGGGPLRLSGGAAWERNDVDGHGWDSSETDAELTFAPALLFGLNERTEFARLDAAAELDRTRMEHLQVRGFSLSGGWSWYEGVGGTRSSFHRVQGDARAYLPVNERQLFALRLLAEDRLGEDGRGVPFTHLAELGDEDGLRGHSGRRFRDRALLAAQAEWRYEVFWHPGFPDLRIEGFAFADAGTVGPSLSSVAWDDFEVTPGIGLRYVDDGDARAEGFIARGGGRWRLGFGFGRTF